MSDAQATNPSKRAGDASADATPDGHDNIKTASNPTAGGSMDVEDDNDEIDDLAEIDPSNIISGSRTRGKKIDFSKADEGDAADEDDDEDEDVVVGDETIDMDDEEDSGEEDEEEGKTES
ncbi:hypothetical protein MJO29_000524 [Puccinia striiformis f. sp. tritici]|uniref:uncharacterized protein n=1 Tax=Puccinia striiformis f. sp. tritici TaxID=168172 RepID=UPI002007E4BE|nr:uncharacterized protein Pst134EA_032411 [Puccinia striiformis f. sp. tritici]XP_047812896.1 hypothetical protein Pst134EA_000513 [Puccinia striiformis f. sp. tritici]KAH9444292.1 hypothetical protein Pst134EA_032411 [Puccinia striiformis f. sp. tritici]KAH9473442.1 hypothetical protein Pst134EA_000513 [Puccinia striiformis f. sp. tritici]KAI7967247.1 hypothetical protein MJO29_000524 [Puccinia striiformis f. sp. tritici]